MMNLVCFYLVIFLSNIIHGITGFAGTILAMPFGLMLVGYATAKPVVNVLGLLSGIYVFVGFHDSVNWKELKKIVVVMAAGIVGGILIRGMLAGREQMLYRILGIFVILLSIQGLAKQLQIPGSTQQQKDVLIQTHDTPLLYLLLAAAGIIHGIFVSGGPLLIGYLTRKVRDKVSFRATISTIWIFLNSLILFDDIRAGLWDLHLVSIQLISVPFMLAGMFIGGKLYAIMSQKLFMVITYILLLISGAYLLMK